MSKQATQREVIDYIHDEDFLDTGLTVNDRKMIKNLHRELKEWFKTPKEVREVADIFKDYTLNECSSGTYDYYADSILFLLENDDLSLIWGYHKYRLNTSSLWRFLEKLMDIKNDLVNY